MSAPETRAILIGGSSHSGKSTLAAALGAEPGWTDISTDSLARHPGRPWRVGEREVKPHVAAHYRDLSVDELITDVLCHYKTMWPDIETLITSHTLDKSKPRLVLEGSALWPEQVATLESTGVNALWLTASDDLFVARIKADSGFGHASSEERVLIEKFLARTLRYNNEMMQVVERLGLAVLSVDGLSEGNVKTEAWKLIG